MVDTKDISEQSTAPFSTYSLDELIASKFDQRVYNVGRNIDKFSKRRKLHPGNKLIDVDEWKEIKLIVKERCNGTELGYSKYIEPLEQGGHSDDLFRIIVPEYVQNKRFAVLSFMFKEEFCNVLKEKYGIEYEIEFVLK